MKAETIQDPSAQMKRALFRSLAIGAVAVVLYMFCVEPCQSSLAKARKEHEDLKGQQAAMVLDLKGADQLKSRLDALETERKKYLDGLLEPSLGSYGTAAGALLKPIAEDVGLAISVDSVDLPMLRLPLPPPPLSPQLYARKPIRLTCTGSYMRIISFLQRVEEQLPLVSLEAFSLKTQRDPDNQLATIVLEWPIKGENTAAAAQGGAKK